MESANKKIEQSEKEKIDWENEKRSLNHQLQLSTAEADRVVTLETHIKEVQEQVDQLQTESNELRGKLKMRDDELSARYEELETTKKLLASSSTAMDDTERLQKMNRDQAKTIEEMAERLNEWKQKYVSINLCHVTCGVEVLMNIFSRAEMNEKEKEEAERRLTASLERGEKLEEALDGKKKELQAEKTKFEEFEKEILSSISE